MELKMTDLEIMEFLNKLDNSIEYQELNDKIMELRDKTDYTSIYYESNLEKRDNIEKEIKKLTKRQKKVIKTIKNKIIENRF